LVLGQPAWQAGLRPIQVEDAVVVRVGDHLTVQEKYSMTEAVEGGVLADQGSQVDFPFRVIMAQVLKDSG
jgi:hypothetical protein